MKHWLALPALVLLAAGCAQQPQRPEPAAPAPASAGQGVPRDEPRARLGNPPFYEVASKRYVVLASGAGHVERGVASWYGPTFHGGRTATGEIYDMNAMTGAHPTLPLPTWVQVTNLQNGRSVVVRLNDRGPFSSNRIIDLSRAAAEQLDMIRAGTAMVEIRSLAGGSPAVETEPASQPAAAQRFYAQAGAFADEGNAQRLAGRLRDARVGDVAISETRVDGRRLFRVRVGPVSGVDEFDALIEKLQRAGVETARLALD
ncbi:MAG: septal ring lytic transglycosylase RlpA family protein [Gammaproteobacteria bacterium]|nr:septal ring lytic transglycosylase RlpA family protein [Gammaproteobacteria bacterium]